MKSQEHCCLALVSTHILHNSCSFGVVAHTQKVPRVWDAGRFPPDPYPLNVQCLFTFWFLLHFLPVAPYLQTHQAKLKTKLIYYMACKAAAFKETSVYQKLLHCWRLRHRSTCNFEKKMSEPTSQLEKSNLAQRKQLKQSCIWTLCLVPSSVWTLVRKQMIKHRKHADLEENSFYKMH